jgi:hypothetical protein
VLLYGLEGTARVRREDASIPWGDHHQTEQEEHHTPHEHDDHHRQQGRPVLRHEQQSPQEYEAQQQG